MPANAASSEGVIQKRVLVRASPDTVFCALTDAKQLTEWFCDHAEADLRIGGELRAYWRHGKQEYQGRALFRRLDRSCLVELDWIDDGMGKLGRDERHTLTYTIRSRKDGSELLVCDEGYPPPDPEAMVVLEDGWISVLRDLKDYCEALERSSKPKRLPRPRA
jgi:uncharacterized protein YndB with AHSA1/START domain